MLAPYRRYIPGRLRLRDGKAVHRTITSEETRNFGAAWRCRAPPVPPALPDWGLEPAASSWIRLRLPPLEPRHDHDHDPPLHHLTRESNGAKQVHRHYHPWRIFRNNMATILELRSLFEGVHGILAVYYSSFRHVLLADFVTRTAARKARSNKFYGCGLRDRSLNIAFFSNDKYVLGRDSPVRSWARLGTSMCIEVFDSSLGVEEIRTMLARHFFGGSDDDEGIVRVPTDLDGSSIDDDEGIVRVPTDLDGSSIEKAYIKYGSWCGFSEALNLNGSSLEGRKLCVTECKGGSRFWDGHITPNGPGTGKRKLFNGDSDGD